jgi:hypothetical protein
MQLNIRARSNLVHFGGVIIVGRAVPAATRSPDSSANKDRSPPETAALRAHRRGLLSASAAAVASNFSSSFVPDTGKLEPRHSRWRIDCQPHFRRRAPHGSSRPKSPQISAYGTNLRRDGDPRLNWHTATHAPLHGAIGSAFGAGALAAPLCFQPTPAPGGASTVAGVAIESFCHKRSLKQIEPATLGTPLRPPTPERVNRTAPTRSPGAVRRRQTACGSAGI